MADFIAKWSIFCSLHAALLNITFKPDILNISLFPQILIMPKEKDKFYIYILQITKSYNTLKLHKKHAHTELIF